MKLFESIKSSILGNSHLFSLYNLLIGAKRGSDIFVREYVCPEAGPRVLDVGCGNGRFAPYFRNMDYTGIDGAAAYIEDARRKYPGAQFICGDICTHPFAPGSADLAVIYGVLHHLDDTQCAMLLKNLARALTPGGTLVIAEPVYMQGQNPVARFIIRNDRGKNVRWQMGYEQLLAADFAVTENTVRHDLLTIPFTHVIFRATPRA